MGKYATTIRQVEADRKYWMLECGRLYYEVAKLKSDKDQLEAALTAHKKTIAKLELDNESQSAEITDLVSKNKELEEEVESEKQERYIQEAGNDL